MSGRSGVAVTITAEDRASKTIDQVNRRIASMRAPVDRVSKSLAKFGDVTGINALGKSMRDVSQQSFQAFSNLSRMAGPLGAITSGATIAGVAALAAEWAKTGTALEHASARANMSVTQFSALQGVAALTGVSTQSMASGLTKLNDNLKLASVGRAPDATQAFQYLHLSIYDANKQIRSGADILPELIDKLHDIKDPTLQAMLATQAFGGAGEEMLPIIRLGSAELARRTAIAQHYNEITPEMTARAVRLTQAEGELGESIRGVGNKLADDLEPALTPFLHGLAEIINFSPGLDAALLGIAGGFVAIKTVLIAIQGLSVLKTLGLLAKEAPAVAAAAEAAAGSGAAAAGASAATTAVGGAAAAALLAPGAVLAGGAAVGAGAAYVGAQLVRSQAGNAQAAGFTQAADFDEFGRPTAYINPATGAKRGASNFDHAAPAGVAAPAGAAAAPASSDISQVIEAGPGYNVVRTADGAIVRQTGQRGWRDNNPGNLDYGPFAQSHGATGTDGREAIFPSRAVGEKAQEDLLFTGSGYKGLTVSQAIARYAPPSENNTAAYQSSVLSALGGRDVTLDQLSPSERAKMMAAMRQVEGSRPGQTQIVQAAPRSSGLLAGIGNAIIPSAAAAEIAPPAAGIGGGTGASSTPATANITGGANLNVKFDNAPPGMKTSTTTEGNAFAGAPKVETPMNFDWMN